MLVTQLLNPKSQYCSYFSLTSTLGSLVGTKCISVPIIAHSVVIIIAGILTIVSIIVVTISYVSAASAVASATVSAVIASYTAACSVSVTSICICFITTHAHQLPSVIWYFPYIF